MQHSPCRLSAPSRQLQRRHRGLPGAAGPVGAVYVSVGILDLLILLGNWAGTAVVTLGPRPVSGTLTYFEKRTLSVRESPAIPRPQTAVIDSQGPPRPTPLTLRERGVACSCDAVAGRRDIRYDPSALPLRTRFGSCNAASSLPATMRVSARGSVSNRPPTMSVSPLSNRSVR